MDYAQTIKSAKVVLVEFYASWCPHCNRMKPIVAEVKALMEGKADVYQYDVDANEQLAATNNVKSIPTFIAYKDGVEAWRFSGELTRNELVKRLTDMAEQ